MLFALAPQRTPFEAQRLRRQQHNPPPKLFLRRRPGRQLQDLTPHRLLNGAMPTRSHRPRRQRGEDHRSVVSLAQGCTWRSGAVGARGRSRNLTRNALRLLENSMPLAREDVLAHQKRKQSIKAQGGNHTEVNGGDRLRLVAQERFPALRPRPPPLRHVFRNRGLGDLEPQHQQFAVKSGALPTWGFPGSSGE
jgi:hypothetical protein